MNAVHTAFDNPAAGPNAIPRERASKRGPSLFSNTLFRERYQRLDMAPRT